MDIIIDTDYVLESAKKISDTSDEILKSFVSLQKICDDLVAESKNPNLVLFQTNLVGYLSRLKRINNFYGEIVTIMNDLAKEYDDVDNNDAIELKNYIGGN